MSHATENDVKRAIIDYLIYRGALVLRINSGAATSNDPGQRRRFVPFVLWFARGEGKHTAGVSDVLAILNGRAVFVECKRPGKRGQVSEAQAAFLERVTEAGGIAVVAESVDDLIEAGL